MQRQCTMVSKEKTLNSFDGKSVSIIQFLRLFYKSLLIIGMENALSFLNNEQNNNQTLMVINFHRHYMMQVFGTGSISSGGIKDTLKFMADYSDTQITEMGLTKV